jgi:hypothetical protein
LKAGAILNITAATNFAAFNFAASLRHIFKQPGPKAAWSKKIETYRQQGLRRGSSLLNWNS